MRSEEDVLAGILTLSFGGTEKSLRELRINELRDWKKLFTQSLSGLDQLDSNNTSELGQIMDVGGNTILDLVVVYDKENVLGGRGWLEENATETEVYRAFRAMLDAAFPFVRDAMGALAQVQAIRKAVESGTPNSTNGLLPTGDSTLKPSKSG